MDPVIIRKDSESDEYVSIYGEYEGRGELLSDALTDLAAQLADEGQ